jgi:hypothetical protein
MKQLDQYIRCGYELTGFTAIDGRFEVIRQPKGVYGARVTWGVWDHHDDTLEGNVWVPTRLGGTPWETMKSAKAGLQSRAEDVTRGEISVQTKEAWHHHFAAWPDTAERWYSPEHCRKAGWKLTNTQFDGTWLKVWTMPNESVQASAITRFLPRQR